MLYQYFLYSLLISCAYLYLCHGFREANEQFCTLTLSLVTWLLCQCQVIGPSAIWSLGVIRTCHRTSPLELQFQNETQMNLSSLEAKTRRHSFERSHSVRFSLPSLTAIKNENNQMIKSAYQWVWGQCVTQRDCSNCWPSPKMLHFFGWFVFIWSAKG